MKITPLQIRDALRDFLNSGQVNMSEMERTTPLSKSWLSKFRRGEMNNPTIDQLEEVNNYRLALGTKRVKSSRRVSG
jgi:transcriptional regulator with XRE-family HTH domain